MSAFDAWNKGAAVPAWYADTCMQPLGLAKIIHAERLRAWVACEAAQPGRCDADVRSRLASALAYCRRRGAAHRDNGRTFVCTGCVEDAFREGGPLVPAQPQHGSEE